MTNDNDRLFREVNRLNTQSWFSPVCFSVLLRGSLSIYENILLPGGQPREGGSAKLQRVLTPLAALEQQKIVPFCGLPDPEGP